MIDEIFWMVTKIFDKVYPYRIRMLSVMELSVHSGIGGIDEIV